jgi:hypothetical protein
MSHGEKVTKGVLFPILGEVIGVKIDHKHIEGKSNQTIALGTDPVAHMAVKNPSNDERDLMIFLWIK